MIPPSDSPCLFPPHLSSQNCQLWARIFHADKPGWMSGEGVQSSLLIRDMTSRNNCKSPFFAGYLRCINWTAGGGEWGCMSSNFSGLVWHPLFLTAVLSMSAEKLFSHLIRCTEQVISAFTWVAEEATHESLPSPKSKQKSSIVRSTKSRCSMGDEVMKCAMWWTHMPAQADERHTG